MLITNKDKESVFWKEQPVQKTIIFTMNKKPVMKKITDIYNLELNNQITQNEKWFIHEGSSSTVLEEKFINFVYNNYTTLALKDELKNVLGRGFMIILLDEKNEIKGLIHYEIVKMFIDGEKYKFGYTDYLVVRKDLRKDNIAGKLIAKLTLMVQEKYGEALPTIYSNHKSLKRNFSHFLEVNTYSLELSVLNILVKMYYQKNPERKIIKRCKLIRGFNYNNYLKKNFRCSMILNSKKTDNYFGVKYEDCFILGDYKTKDIFEIKLINIPNKDYNVLIHCLRGLIIYLKNENVKMIYFNDFGNNGELKEIIPFKNVSQTFYYFYNLEVDSFYPNDMVCFI